MVQGGVDTFQSCETEPSSPGVGLNFSQICWLADVWQLTRAWYRRVAAC